MLSSQQSYYSSVIS